ncbi:MAG: hypothetical protein M3178_10585 [Pseudomonadota bacterium]|nr:hypothetical protein [Pseudomonadota bacterium]
MTRDGISKKQRQDDQRRKRTQAASALATGAKNPLKAISVTPRPQRPSVGLSRAASEPMAPHSYPVTRAAIGKRQTPGSG